MDHLVEAGKRAVPLEKHAEKEAPFSIGFAWSAWRWWEKSEENEDGSTWKYVPLEEEIPHFFLENIFRIVIKSRIQGQIQAGGHWSPKIV